MKRMIVSLAVLMMIAGTAWSLESVDGQKLTGSHFTLNIISVQNPKTADMDSDTGKGNTIFVNAEGKSQINLVKSGSSDAPQVEADEFAVLDKNATDSDGAKFALPDTGLLPYNITTGEGQTTDGTTSDYSLYARPLGKPGGWSTIQTCAELLDSSFAGLLSGDFVDVLNETCAFDDGDAYPSYASIEIVGQEVTFRAKGKTTFTNVTAQLLTIVFAVEVEVVTGVDADGNPITEIVTEYVRVPIFSDILQDEFWEYTQGTDEDGNPTPLKLLQIRIYPWGTDVSDWDLDAWK